MSPRALFLILAAGWVGALAPTARANDSALSYGGSPRPLDSHPTVSMKSELIKMVVGERVVTVDCRFVFENHGGTCKVRMGFPDQGRGAADPDEEGPKNPPTGTFNSFKSWVGGQPVKTTVARAAHSGNFWHVKTVTFPGHGTLEVRDIYTVDVGNSVGFEVPCSVQWTSYLLHTGASWHGNIGRSEIVVEFRRKGVKSPIAARAILKERPHPNFVDHANDPRAVYYNGPCRPTTDGMTMRFVRTNWRPTERDDIRLVFEVRRLKMPPSPGR
jgi:hypothetical protein